MSDSAALNLIPVANSNKSTKKKGSINSLEEIRGRRSNELVIGLCGAVGAGVKSLNETLKDLLIEKGYKIVSIRLSKLIAESFPEEKEKLSKLVGYKRYTEFQDKGDNLRRANTNHYLAELAIQEIYTQRQAVYEQEFGFSEDEDEIRPERIAYILDQLKHPDEISLLKEVYDSSFYVLGLLRTEAERKKNLREEDISVEDISTLMERDRKDSGNKNGQQVEKTIQLSDYFIKNMDTRASLNSSVDRFLELVHGSGFITPTVDETGMYTAFSASLRSICLSRQVGAAIFDTEGNILSTGCNDVPKSGGGLYSSEDFQNDKRCYNKGGKCYNDSHKGDLERQIASILEKEKIGNSKEIAKSIIAGTKADSITEYSRAVYAEMDAIISLARNPSLSSVGRVLYCTTYPCHGCTRHIIAAGIKRVVYIEPYEKSLAGNLYDDSITTSDNLDDSKICFENFEGVSPKRYVTFFMQARVRKANGKAVFRKSIDSNHVDHQHIHGYVDYEAKIIQILEEKSVSTSGSDEN
ncbi:anti-phage dCTP deaminase [Marinomonas fungiae]|uniref:Deoxycytidylate deaminase n=1 Tax=Marinomonas fungiae TaxID=1137284 RepID=A0A0K6IME5_9GAMM|nr:anti-phage dCTP deaminase [Marinomonas fungiae]CUB04268.1 Deoxycytidylate deaminase [Marinomonas fungiae]